jgi:pimeloyl-ACP methyl ester carboxylesterase
MRASTLRLCAAILLAALSAACLGPPYPKGSITQLFPQAPQPQSHYYSVDDYRIHYVEMSGSGADRIVFIHGSPGTWQAWASYLNASALRSHATLIAVDRPGYGASEPGHVVPSLRAQAALLEPLLNGNGVPTIVVGHSLGGPIAAELAMDYPQEVAAAILIAPSIDPATEQPRWYNELMQWWLVRQVMPAEFSWSNREIMPLQTELATMAPRWKSLAVPVTVIQGDSDTLVDPRTAEFAERMLPASGHVIRVPKAGHFVLWKQPDVIVDAIVDALQKTDAARARAEQHMS